MEETVYMPAMTQWQFYVEFAVQFVVGLLFAIGMLYLAQRDPTLQWQPSNRTKVLSDKLGYGLIIVAGFASFFSLREVCFAFVDDASTAMAESVVDTAGEVIDGTYTAPDTEKMKDYLHGVIWGKPNSWQQQALILMAIFWVAIGWCAYVFDFKLSPVGVLKKMLKAVGYVSLSVLMFIVPMCFHRFDGSEFKVPLLLAAIAAVCIAASHTYFRATPPPLPEA